MPAAASDPGSPGLWRHRDFLLLWTGQSVSELGSAVTVLVLPLIAVVLLRASTFQVGLLAAAATVPFLIVALPAGLIVDRMAKRRLMIGCDAARMLIVGSVPIAAAIGRLTLFQLYAVAVTAGILTVSSTWPTRASPRCCLTAISCPTATGSSRPPRRSPRSPGWDWAAGCSACWARGR